MYLLAVFSPFLGSILAGLGGRYLGARGSGLVTVFGLFISFLLSLLLWYEVGVQGSSVYINLGSWFKVSSVLVQWTFYFDSLTVCMMLTVTLVSFCVHLYSMGYMQLDPHLPRFMSYLSLFTGFMLVLVSANNMIQMLIGWEGYNISSLNGSLYTIQSSLFLCYKQKNVFFSKSKLVCAKQILTKQTFTRPMVFTSKNHHQNFFFNQNFFLNQNFFFIKSFYTARKPANMRLGEHTFLFHQMLTGFVLGDGWLEKHGLGVRLGISLTEKFADVAQFYKILLYGLGYTDNFNLGEPLKRKCKKTKPYYQIRTFTFSSLFCFYNLWYCNKTKTKLLPTNLRHYLTPFCLAIWIMGDGSGMKDGGFKISSHSFNKKDNEFLSELLFCLYGLKATVHNEGTLGLFYIRIWKRSVPKLKWLVMPYLLPSCYYKFRFVKQN